jgi:hypothetical protein
MSTPIYDGMPQPPSGPIQPPEPTGSASVPAPSPVNPQPMLQSDVQAMIDAAVTQVESKYAARVKSLEDQLEATRNPARGGPAATHAAGPDDSVAPSWGLVHQELSRLGKITDEIRSAVGIKVG